VAWEYKIHAHTSRHGNPRVAQILKKSQSGWATKIYAFHKSLHSAQIAARPPPSKQNNKSTPNFQPALFHLNYLPSRCRIKASPNPQSTLFHFNHFFLRETLQCLATSISLFLRGPSALIFINPARQSENPEPQNLF
jgi:hypothetical protein